MNHKPVILYAEDDPDDRELLRDALREKNVEYEIVEVANGRQALLYLQSKEGIENPPSLIVLDMNMPVLNGRETLAIIKSENETKKIPIVVFTTSASPFDREFCNKFSVEMFTKPSSHEELLKVVDNLLKFCRKDRINP